MSEHQVVDVAVLGAGPAGLAAAAALDRRQVRAVILERATVGATWSRHYDRLTLDTDRLLSALPGRPLPRQHGRWVSRDAFVDYLLGCATDLDVRTCVETLRLDRQGELWALRGTRFRARRVVVATGRNRVPFTPRWPGLFSGPLLHSAAYRNPAPYAGQVVLVVGAGRSGAEIAADLVAPGAAGARHVLLSARPVQPAARDDDLWAAVHAGRVTVVGAVTRLDGWRVHLADGTSVTPDAVITATGWRPALEALVGHLGVLDDHGLPRRHAGQEAAAGLHFVGFRTAPTGAVHGDVHRAGHDAEHLAAALTGAGQQRAAVDGVPRRLPLPA